MTTSKAQKSKIDFRLPHGTDSTQISKLLSKIAFDNGFISHQRPEVGSTGIMLFALATGRAKIINLDKKEIDESETTDLK